ACTMDWAAEDTPRLLREFPEIRQVPKPRAPGAAGEDQSEISVFEWLDRAIEPADANSPSSARSAIVLANVFVTANSLRLSSPRAENLETVEDRLFARLDERPASVRRDASPLPLPFLDADLWLFRIPSGVNSGRSAELSREAIEHYFENIWI